jgi:hypothetical protein
VHLGRTGRVAEIALPLAGLAVAGYVLYHNIWPVPASPFDVFPYVVAGWLAVGVLLALRPATRAAPAGSPG